MGMQARDHRAASQHPQSWPLAVLDWKAVLPLGRFLGLPRVYKMSDVEDIVHALRSPAEVTDRCRRRGPACIGERVGP